MTFGPSARPTQPRPFPPKTPPTPSAAMFPSRSLVIKPYRTPPRTDSRMPMSCGDGGRNRKGIAAVEAAVTLPLIVFLVFGAIEVTNGIYLSQTLSVAAYEAARQAAQPGASMTKIRSRADEVFQAHGIKGYVLRVTPAIDASTPRGTVFTVRTEAPTGSLSSVSVGISAGRTSGQQVTMVRN